MDKKQRLKRLTKINLRISRDSRLILASVNAPVLRYTETANPNVVVPVTYHVTTHKKLGQSAVLYALQYVDVITSVALYI